MEQNNTKKFVILGVVALTAIGVYFMAGRFQKTEIDGANTNAEEQGGVVLPAYVYTGINYVDGKFVPMETTVILGAQVNFYNKSDKNIELVSGVEDCSAELKPNESLGCVYNEVGNYEVNDMISGARGTVRVM